MIEHIETAGEVTIYRLDPDGERVEIGTAPPYTEREALDVIRGQRR